MWSDDSRFSIFQNDGRTRVRKNLTKQRTLHAQCPLCRPIEAVSMIWSFFNGSGLGSTISFDNKMKSQQYLKVINDQVLPSIDFCSPMKQAYSRTTMPRSTEH
ncbi:hypothetical protein AVEN_269133-1 [Araneus ventricosus]|uniref:Uncharacterized protein n=1 Tax=Araneus ventricosus TaxID=182803 RepID=A0A4Y2GY98_ARAVE|nr:hypothetical protein AVEN_269133-1 [Araneus ventricosus]